jgi:hypothetical protein
MRATTGFAFAGLLLLCLPAHLSFVQTASAQTAAHEPPGLVIATTAGPQTALTAEAIAQLPATQVSVSFGTEHGTQQASFEGPLLWAVLEHVHAIDTAKPGGQVRLTIQVSGRDGYTAVLALGEISPEFEGKQVILAERMDGQPLGPEHFRIVVPGDRRGGRSVRDVVRIAVTTPPTDQR